MSPVSESGCPMCDCGIPLLEGAGQHAPDCAVFHFPVSSSRDRADGWSDEEIARLFHENYERLAPQFDYKTRESSAVAWEGVPEPNRELMIATVRAVLNAVEAVPLSRVRELEEERAYLAKQVSWEPGRKDELGRDITPIDDALEALSDAGREIMQLEAREARLVEALEEAEKGIGSLLWVMNNRHNWADPKWDGLAESAEEDARRALSAIRALSGGE